MTYTDRLDTLLTELSVGRGPGLDAADPSLELMRSIDGGLRIVLREIVEVIEAALGDVDGGGGGGGSSTAAERALYTGNPVTVLHGDTHTTNMTWDTLGSGVELLDRSDLANPTVITAGIYAVTVSVEASEFLTAGGVFLAVLHLDADGDDAVCEMTSNDQNPSGGDAFTAIVSLNCTYYVPVDGVIRVAVMNMDGAASRGFRLRESMIQRLT